MEAILRPAVEGYIPAIGRVTLFTESQGQGKQATFRAIVLDWDKENPEWSMKTSNGVRYHRKATLEVFNRALEENGSLPIMYNHITEGAEADQLGVIERVIDTSEGMIIEGYLNMTKKRVSDEIIPGFLKNVSLQVIAEDYYEDEKNETIFAKPSRALEVSFVPVNGREGAKLLDLAIKESLSGKSPQQAQNLSMEMARKAVAFEEIEQSFLETDLGIAYKLIEGKLSGIDKEIKKLQDKGMLDKDIVRIISKKYGVSEEELDELLGEGFKQEDITTGNSGAATATKLHGVDKEKEALIDEIKDKQYEGLENFQEKYVIQSLDNGKWIDSQYIFDTEREAKDFLTKGKGKWQLPHVKKRIKKKELMEVMKESFKIGDKVKFKKTGEVGTIYGIVDRDNMIQFGKNNTKLIKDHDLELIKEALIDEIKDKQYELYSKVEALIDGMTEEELKESISLQEKVTPERYPTKISHDDLRKAAKMARIDEDSFIKFWWAAFKNDTMKSKAIQWAKNIADQPIDYSTNNPKIIQAYNFAGFSLK